jgi:uncharacterized repeat protein (TIGR04076 family)
MPQQKKIKITVLKTMFNPDLAEEYCPGEAGPCDIPVGREYISETFLQQPEGFCGWAWNDLHKVCLTLLKGGRFELTKDDKTMIACCTDGIRPVVFKVERLDD